MHPHQKLETLINHAVSLEEASEALSLLLTGGYAVWTDGQLYHVKHLVDRINGLKVEVFSNDHMPPHFHIRSTNYNVSLRIDDCTLLSGSIPDKELRLIQYWHQRNRALLLSKWKSSRPG